MGKWFQNGSGYTDPTAAAAIMEERAVAEARTHMISDERLAKMTLEEIKPRICGKFNGDVLKCVDCPVGCRYGRRVTEIMEQRTRPVDPADRVTVQEFRRLSPKAKEEAVQRRYEHAISSGDPEGYLTECGMTQSSINRFLKARRHGADKQTAKGKQVVEVDGLDNLIDQMKQKSQELTDESISLNDEIKKLENKRSDINDQINSLNEAIKTLRKVGGLL